MYEAYDVTTKAYFPGGDTGLVKYIIHNCKFTDEDEKCQYKRVFLSFVININGNITDVKLLRTSVGHETHEQEAVKFTESTSGMWVPATRNDKRVNMIYRAGIPFDAELRNNLKEKLGI